MKSSKTQAALFVFLGLAVVLVPNLAMAAGLEKVNSFFTTLSVSLRYIGISVVSLAVMWAGYKYLFQQAQFRDISNVIFGSLLIGGATEFAGYLLA